MMGLLDAHPELEVGYELFSIDCLMGLGMTKVPKQIKSHLAEERIREFCLRCSQEAEKHKGKYWGNKITTEQIYGLEDNLVVNPESGDVLDTFFNQFLKDVKVIFVSRDGRTCVRSKMARTGQSLEHACTRWKYSIRILRFLQQRRDVCYILKYEDLVRNPEKKLKSICKFLKIAFSEDMFAGVANQKMLPEYQKKFIDTSKLTLKGVPHQCIPLLSPELYETGYLTTFQYVLYRLRYSRIFFITLATSQLFLIVLLVLLLCVLL